MLIGEFSVEQNISNISKITLSLAQIPNYLFVHSPSLLHSLSVQQFVLSLKHNWLCSVLRLAQKKEEKNLSNSIYFSLGCSSSVLTGHTLKPVRKLHAFRLVERSHVACTQIVTYCRFPSVGPGRPLLSIVPDEMGFRHSKDTILTGSNEWRILVGLWRDYGSFGYPPWLFQPEGKWSTATQNFLIWIVFVLISGWIYSWPNWWSLRYELVLREFFFLSHFVGVTVFFIVTCIMHAKIENGIAYLWVKLNDGLKHRQETYSSLEEEFFFIDIETMYCIINVWKNSRLGLYIFQFFSSSLSQWCSFWTCYEIKNPVNKIYIKEHTIRFNAKWNNNC